MDTVLSLQASPGRSLEHSRLPVPHRFSRPVEVNRMRSLDSLRYAYAFTKVTLTVPFDRSTGASKSPRLNSFSDFNALYMRGNALRLHGRHQR